MNDFIVSKNIPLKFLIASEVATQVLIFLSISFLQYDMKLKAICPSLCLTITLKAQQSVHQLKQDLLEMKAESFGTAKYVLKVYTCDYSST